MITSTVTLVFIKCEKCAEHYRKSVSMWSPEKSLQIDEPFKFECPNCGLVEYIAFKGTAKSPALEKVLKDAMNTLEHLALEDLKKKGRKNASTKN